MEAKVLTLTLRAIDGEAGVVLPQEALARLDVKLGDTVVLTEDGGGYRLFSQDPAVAEQLKHAERIMDEDQAVLQRLAR